MRILLKYPTRGRPQQFLTTLAGWVKNANNPSDIAILVSYDADDATMTPEIIARAEAIHPALIAVRGKSKTKIEACNADLNEYAGDWEVVLLCSDDMWCSRMGWDGAVRREMYVNCNGGTDGALWFFDGAQKKINTLECVGRDRYRKFGQLYHGSYASFWCDNESTAIGLRDKKLFFVESPICSHQHPAWLGGMKTDATYRKNHPFWAQDQANFYRRQALGFPA